MSLQKTLGPARKVELAQATQAEHGGTFHALLASLFKP
jgi:hypothetical protein